MTATMVKINDSLLEDIHKDPQELPELLRQCQDTALKIGTSLESMGNQYAYLVSLLEDYCENIYLINENLPDENICCKLSKKIRKQLIDFQRQIKCEIPDDRKEVVFLPYKASMWDSLESAWKAADKDDNTDAYVIPIPYYDRNADGSLGTEHYEGHLYPKYVPIMRYDQYDFEGRRPDVIFIHNAYDKANYVTSVHPFFYSDNLKKFTDKLIYIPYFVLDEINPKDTEAVDGIKHFCILPGIFHADKVVVQSEAMRQIYINVLTETVIRGRSVSKEKAIREYWEKKIDGSGSPKIEKVLNTKKEDLDIPEEWMQIIRKPTGESKKIILYNTSVSALLTYGNKALEKMQRVFQIFHSNSEDIALLWRPHPLIQATIESMRPQLWAYYHEVCVNYQDAGWGIYDDTADLDRAIVMSDGYYGDPSSLVHLCRSIGMPVMLQNMDL